MRSLQANLTHYEKTVFEKGKRKPGPLARTGGPGNVINSRKTELLAGASNRVLTRTLPAPPPNAAENRYSQTRKDQARRFRVVRYVNARVNAAPLVFVRRTRRLEVAECNRVKVIAQMDGLGTLGC